MGMNVRSFLKRWSVLSTIYRTIVYIRKFLCSVGYQKLVNQVFLVSRKLKAASQSAILLAMICAYFLYFVFFLAFVGHKCIV